MLGIAVGFSIAFAVILLDPPCYSVVQIEPKSFQAVKSGQSSPDLQQLTAIKVCKSRLLYAVAPPLGIIMIDLTIQRGLQYMIIMIPNMNVTSTSTIHQPLYHSLLVF